MIVHPTETIYPAAAIGRELSTSARVGVGGEWEPYDLG